MEQREKFVVLVQSDRYTKKELCEQFGISRKTGHPVSGDKNRQPDYVQVVYPYEHAIHHR